MNKTVTTGKDPNDPPERTDQEGRSPKDKNFGDTSDPVGRNVSDADKKAAEKSAPK